MNAESLSMCTEGLGVESFDGVEHLRDDQQHLIDDHHEEIDHTVEKQVAVSEILCGELKRSRIKGKKELPPPISSIGLNGNPWSTCLESYRSNGRFILKEVRIPNQELLHACREDGRLKLQFIQSDDELLDDQEDEDQDDDGDEKCYLDGN
ncbi:hypothetical protein QVD17_37487 [Tagetes erecta]|uniref:FAF domain-containing protein n=1 Tax=Tagetes erecta TaxID=13708 RepID=A0AAD8NIE0_TARER|nr:hypothetical protein QVD17_37487 [Tagetes erecta]